MLVTKDNFVWLIVTNKAEKIWDSNLFELFTLYEDDSESLITTREELDFAIDFNYPIAIAVGQLIITNK